MKKIKLSVFNLLVLFLFSSASVSAQSIKDLLNSSTVKNAVTAVTGGKALTAENLSGKWIYVQPAVELEGDNALKNIAGSVAATELEKKLKETCSKAGIVEGLFNYSFQADGSFTNLLKGKTIKGTYVIDEESKTIELKYGKIGNKWRSTLKARVILTNDQLSLLFKADKLLDFISTVSSVSNNSTLKAVNKLAEQYDGLMLGFELKQE